MSADKTITLYHYTRVENVEKIKTSGILFPSIAIPGNPSSDAQWGDGQYLTDLTPSESEGVTRFQHSKALFDLPWMWGGRGKLPDIGWLSISFGVHEVRRVNSLFGSQLQFRSIYLYPNDKDLSIADRFVTDGILRFKPSQSGKR